MRARAFASRIGLRKMGGTSVVLSSYFLRMGGWKKLVMM